MSDNLRVLLIEDDAGDAILVERTLQRCRQLFSLRHSESLEAAIAQLAGGEFDVALLDLSLPDSFGLSGLVRLQASAPDLPIVVLTGLSDDELALQSLERGAQDYLVKGGATSELLERTLRYAVQRQQIQTENRRLLDKMEALACQDPLTGVLNRHAFAESLEREWQRARRQRRPLACVLLDIDFFKRVNDTYGHAAGDQTLKQVADILRSNSRATDTVGRLGGEEFCLLLPDTGEQEALVWAERVRRKISAVVVPMECDELRITASFGVASLSSDADMPQTIVDRADEAMFVAKHLGRDQVVSFSRLRVSSERPPQIWQGVTLGELASPLGPSLAPWQTLKEAVQTLRAGHADTVPVLGDDGALVGVIGQDDILAASLTSGDLDGAVGDLMHTQLVTFAPDAAASEACEFLGRAAVRQAFVIHDNRPLGVVRRSDFIRWLGDSIHGELIHGGTGIRGRESSRATHPTSP